MNARLELRGIGKFNHGASAALLARQWMRDRDYFTLQTKSSGRLAGDRVAATTGSHRLGGTGSPRTLPPAGLYPLC